MSIQQTKGSPILHKSAPIAVPAATPAIRVTTALAIGAVLLAAFIRFVGINSTLATQETAVALSAVDLINGRAGGTGAPLPELVAAFFFFLAGPNDFLARIGPALVGIATVAIIPFFGPYIGRLTALISAFLVAISPTIAAVSRQLDGEAFVGFFLLLVFLAVLRFGDDRAPVWIGIVGISTGLLLVAGPRGVSAVIALVAIGLAVRVLSISWISTPLRLALGDAKQFRTYLIVLIVAALMTIAVTSTRFLLSPTSIGLVSLNLWLQELNATGGSGMTGASLALISYETLAVLGGIYAIWRMVRNESGESREPGIVSLLAVWAIVEVVLALLGNGRLLGPVAAATLPLLLLTATAVSDLLHTTSRTMARQSIALIGAVPLLIFAYLISAQTSRQPEGVVLNQSLAIWLSLMLAAGYVVLLRFAAGKGFGPVALLGVGAFFLVFTFHTLSALVFRPTPHEWILGSSPTLSVPLLTQGAQSMYEVNGRRPAGVDQALWAPVGWYLRDFDAVKTNTPGFQFSMLVVPEPTTTPGGERYIFEANAGGPPSSVSSLWRWFVWRDIGRALVPRSAILFPVSAG